MNRLYSVAEIRAIEHAAAAVLPDGALMQRAGQSGANAALDLLPFSTNNAKVLVLAGPGNNGGDALEAAAHLAYAGATVTVLHYPPMAQPSAERAVALQRARASEVRFAEIAEIAEHTGADEASAMSAVSEDKEGTGNGESIDGGGFNRFANPANPASQTSPAGGAEALVAGTEWSLVVDGLFGIGLKRPLSGAMGSLVTAVNQLQCPVLALDVPSGLDADTGAIVGGGAGAGADPGAAAGAADIGVAIRATHTITFIADKPGLHTCEGRDYAGLVDLSRLEIDASLFPPASMHVNDVKLFAPAPA
jgi:NAD(P)H-hydrate repair Nnr-like enzyme with NAD(P)H-hydrate epimerase domain